MSIVKACYTGYTCQTHPFGTQLQASSLKEVSKQEFLEIGHPDIIRTCSLFSGKPVVWGIMRHPNSQKHLFVCIHPKQRGPFSATQKTQLYRL